MRLRTVSLLPESVLTELRERFRGAFERLGVNERLALATAMIEGYVSNGRLRQITEMHPRDITLLLRGLVAGKMLDADGKGRGTTYRVTGVPPVDRGASESSAHSNTNPTHLNVNPTHLNDEIFNPCEDLNLLDIAAKVRNTGKADKQLIKETILELCRDRFLTPQQLGKLLNRSYMSLRERYIKQMVEEMLLERRFPNQPSHVNQAYRTREPSP